MQSCPCHRPSSPTVTPPKPRADEERYSRQVHADCAWIRSLKKLLDGPRGLGLLSECSESLALSGVGRVILLEEEEEDDVLDNLGRVYAGAARQETGAGEGMELLVEYLCELNPALEVVVRSPGKVLGLENPRALLCVKRSQGRQKEWDSRCCASGVAFMGVETRGCDGRFF